MSDKAAFPENLVAIIERLGTDDPLSSDDRIELVSFLIWVCDRNISLVNTLKWVRDNAGPDNVSAIYRVVKEELKRGNDYDSAKVGETSPRL